MKKLLALAMAIAIASSCTLLQPTKSTEQPILIGDEPTAGPAGPGISVKSDGTNYPGEKWKNWFVDADQDSFGRSNLLDTSNAVAPKFKKKQPVGYVADSTDCDDMNAAVHPGAAEVLNGIDDDCNGLVDDGLNVAGITLTTTPMMIPEYMGAGGTTDMFINNNPDDPAFVAKMKAGNFNAYIHSEGHFSEYFHWAKPFGTAGNGYNATKPANCQILQGGLCATYARDFNLSWLSLCQNTGTKGIYTCNIQSGTLQELYYAIDQFASQQTFVIIYGQEGASSNYPILTASTYPVKFYQWVDSVTARYPNRKFYHCADIPEVKQNENSGTYSQWVQSFISYRKPDSNKICLRQYYHGFQQYGQLDNATSDTAKYSAAINGSFPEAINKTHVAFPGCKIITSQFSTGVPGYAGKMVVGRCLDMFYYLRADKVMIEDGHFIGSNIIGLKNMLNSLDYKWFSVRNVLYAKPRQYVVCSSLGAQVDIVAGYADGSYCIELQNRSGVAVALPEYWNLDGRIVQPVVTQQAGYTCNGLLNTIGAEYNAVTTWSLAPYSIVMLELH